MRNLISQSFIFLFLASTFVAFADPSAAEAASKRRAQGKPAPTKNSNPVAATYNPNSAAHQQLTRALDLAGKGQYQSAASQLFILSRRSELKEERPQIKYILGLMLMELKMSQVAAFQFVDVIRMNNTKYKKQAIEKLSIVADGLGDDTLLDYAISRVDVVDIPINNKDMINYRIGEIKNKSKDFIGAANYFSRVQPGSSYYNQALFSKGLAELSQNKPDTALDSFRNLLAIRGKSGVTDTNRVAAQLAIARTLYQKQSWDEAIEAYAKVPRDHFLWHQAIFEQSWAMLRGARFRSALSNFQSLHSAYYEDFYIPESLLLRAIVYLYICKYDEMEKVLTLFEKTYGPVRTQIAGFLGRNSSSYEYYIEAEKAYDIKKGKESNANLRLPYLVLKNALEQGDIRRGFQYLKTLSDEKSRIDANVALRGTPLGVYAQKIISSRGKNKKFAMGDMVRAHLQNMRADLADLYEQAGLIRYEMISGKKDTLKKKITGNDLASAQIDDKINREFYVENGYQYYPFKGEYWLDEVGNYHYLGKQSCE